MTTRLMAVVLGLALLASLSCGGGGASGPTVKLVLAPEEGVQIGNLDEALADVRGVVERRAKEFDFDVVSVEATDEIEFAIEVRGITRDEALDTIGRTGLLQLCEPVMNDAGDVAVTTGDVQYQPQTCNPMRDANGELVVENGVITFRAWAPSDAAGSQANPRPDEIVWQPASAEVDGVETELDSRLIRPNSFVSNHPIFDQPQLNFEMTTEGRSVLEDVTERLVERNYPLAAFLDGEPLLDARGGMIAPLVQGVISSGALITGLEEDEAENLRALLNSGAYPFPVRVVD